MPRAMSRVAAFHVLCECLSSITLDRRPRESFFEDSESFSWATVINLAHEYRVSSAVACAMAAGGPESTTRASIPFLTGLAGHYRRRNEEIRSEAIKVAAILNDIEVTPIFMKGGAHLLAGLYPDIAMRQMSDLDILVPAMRINDCLAKLANHGITQVGTYLHPLSHHCRPVSGRGLPVSVELHHKVVAHPNGEFLTSDEVIASAVELENYGVRIAVPSPTCAVIHNIAHAQLNNHDHLYGWIDLKSLLDLALLSRAHGEKLDWNEIRKRFVYSGWGHAWGFHVQWSHRVGARVPSLKPASAFTRLLYRHAFYHVGAPKMLSLNVRLLRPWILLRREMSDSVLRRRLARNLVNARWWKRHLRMVFR